MCLIWKQLMEIWECCISSDFAALHQSQSVWKRSLHAWLWKWEGLSKTVKEILHLANLLSAVADNTWCPRFWILEFWLKQLQEVFTSGQFLATALAELCKSLDSSRRCIGLSGYPYFLELFYWIPSFLPPYLSWILRMHNPHSQGKRIKRTTYWRTYMRQYIVQRPYPQTRQWIEGSSFIPH